jgi:hypothetical protein
MGKCMQIRTILLAIVLLCALSGEARAQFLLEEGKVSLAVSGGDRITKSLLIDNITGESVAVRVYWEDFQYQPPYDGTKLFLPAATGQRTASLWVSFTPKEFTLPPYGKQEVSYTISLPSQIQGGYYGVLFFEKVNEPLKNVSGVDVITRVGCLFFIESKDSNRKAAIQDLQVVGNTVTGQFLNQGNVILIPRTTYNIMDDGGMVADRGEINTLYVPPSAAASWEVGLPGDLNTGHYTLVINSDLGEGDVIVKEIEFVKEAYGGLSIKSVRD